jgi:hypothetical protein
MSDTAEMAAARLRAAIAAGDAPRADDIEEVIAALEHWRAVASERWIAIGALAPRAKELRMRAQELERAIAAARDRLDAADGDVGAAREVLARALQGRGGLE